MVSDATLAWWAAAADADVDAAIRALHDEAAAEVIARRPLCLASGKCCAFREHGHRLYVTGLEAAWTWMDLVRRGEPLPAAATREESAGILRCPLLRDRLCGAHASRPAGCRTYYCDRAAGPWQQELSERLHAQVRDLHDRRGIPYAYAEWTALLRQVGDAWDMGVLPAPSRP